MNEEKSIQQNRIEEAVKRKRKKRISIILVIALSGIAIIGLITYAIKQSNKNLPGTAFPDQGRDHFEIGYPFAYNSNPPTSGPHFKDPAKWGAYREEMHDQILIHNLEHGGVWISYKPEIPDDIRAKLERMYEKYGAKVIVTPRAKNDTDIALAVWTRLDKFNVNEYSDERVENFIKRLRNKTAPEPFAL